MMTVPSPTSVLGRRLERLTGEEADCCLPEYRALGKKTARTARFAESLRRVRALADEHRLLAVSLLKDREELCACEIQAATGLTHATVSHHMKILTDAGLVSATRRGKWMYYRLRDPKWSVVA
jgi:ArsR family transcriptional regulator, arsenate/arsenite/antimonite-responsive transcriptional repressor